jgi:hypothetical protein
VLIAGGMVAAGEGTRLGTPTASAELYDPSTGLFTPAGDMTIPRALHTATLLPNGKVLIAGGSDEDPKSTELNDPVSTTFSSTSDMIVGGIGLATLLADGRVLIVQETAAELYDPATGHFTLAAPYPAPGPWIPRTVTLLADGR